MLTRRPNAALGGDATERALRPRTVPTNVVRASMPPPSTSASAAKPSKFSFDHLFRRIRTKSTTEQSAGDGDRDSKPTRERSDSGSGGDAVRRKLHRTAASIKSSLRPPPLVVSTSTGATATPLRLPPAASSTATATLCQSPGGRANVSLAIPVTPPSAARKQQLDQQRAEMAQSDPDQKHESDDAARSSFSLGSWRDAIEATRTELDSSSSSTTMTIAMASLSTTTITTPPPTLVLVSVGRDLVPDVRAVCCVAPSAPALRLATLYVRQLLRVYVFEVRATKWAAYFLQLVRAARHARTLSRADAVSVRFAICAHVRREAETRQRLQYAQEKLFQRKMTEYRVAMQCVCGTSVLKYGRKGKPHVTHLMIENGDTFKWTSSAKLLSSKTHIAKKSIPLAEIVAVRAGPTTDVLAKALQKGTLALQDAKCTLSLVTAKRTFDIKARSTAEREWLLRSLRFLVELAREHQKQVAQQVELSIMKKMETLAVWKHGRKGRPHKTRLFINRYGELSWQGRTGDTILLEDIEAVEVGHATQVFQRSRRAGFTAARTASRCFSLVTRSRTLDIETASEEQRDWYVVAIRYLMDKVHEKTAAIKREKAEKQLKMLQELCGPGAGVGAGHYPLDAGAGATDGGSSGNVGISMAPELHA